MNHNLQTLIKGQIASNPYASAEELALLVANATPAADLKAFYAHLLVGACRSVANQHRTGSKHGSPKPRPAPTPRPSPPSPKLEARRSWWADMLAVEVDVANGRKLLGDCTITDVQFCVKDRQLGIERISDQIANLERLIALMGEHKVTTVRELPEQTRLRAAS
jgi:hypothetical protein